MGLLLRKILNHCLVLGSLLIGLHREYKRSSEDEKGYSADHINLNANLEAK